MFSTFGAIESIRVLPHKNCGFVNFFNSEDAIRAKHTLYNHEILGLAKGMVKIGFAKVPALKTPVEEEVFTETKENNQQQQQQQEMMVYMMTEMMNNPNMVSAIITERKMIMHDFGEDEKDGPAFQGKHTHTNTKVKTKEKIDLHLPQKYFRTIPAAPELGQTRRIDTSRLRDIKKRLDTGHISVQELEVLAMECLDELVELCSGKYINMYLLEVALNDKQISLVIPSFNVYLKDVQK